MSSSPSSPCLARARHLQVFQHLLQSGRATARRVLGAGAGELLHAVEHTLKILGAELARILVERPRHLRVLAHLLGERLQELVERRPQVVHQLLEFLVGGAALERLTQRLLGGAQLLLGVGDVAVLELGRHRPQPLHHVAQVVVRLGLGEIPVDRAQAEIDAELRRVVLRRDREARRARRYAVARIGIEGEMRRCSISARASGLMNDAAAAARTARWCPRCSASSRAIKRHRHVGAGPRILGQILDGLADAVLGARLRQQ